MAWAGSSAQRHGGLGPLALLSGGCRRPGTPRVAVLLLPVWIKEKHDLGGSDRIRGTWPNTQAWNEFAPLVTKSGHCCLAGPFTTHLSSQDLLGASHGQGLPDS